MAQTPIAQIKTYPLTPRRWSHLEELFGPNGACEGCWCMWWRLRNSEFGKQTASQHKRGLKTIVQSGRRPGILAYVGGKPVGWVSIEPRECFPGLDHSRVLKRVDDQPVWSITCFFIAKGYRRKGLMVPLLRAAVDYARQNGANIVEGYPVDPGDTGMADSAGYTGLVSAFRTAGFEEVARPDDRHHIMRSHVATGKRARDGATR